MALTTFLILAVSSLLLAFAALPSAAHDNNVLLTGDVLDTDASLTNPAASFTMQDDCNLVLYGAQGFVSGTNNRGFNCTLTLNSYGQLVIHGGDGYPVWSTSASTNARGEYAAVLRPDGEVAVYGPMLWSTQTGSSPPAPAPSAANELGAELAAMSMAQNVLFSGQVLNKDDKLATRDYTLVMRSDCSLALTKAAEGDVWSTGAHSGRWGCFVRLGNTGELAVVDDHYRVVWSSRAVPKVGEYVLVLQIHGQAAVYGPIVWSTGPLK